MALLEATGTVAARKPGSSRHAPPAQDHQARGRLSRGRALPRAPRRALDRRQHLQGPRRQRARRPRGGVRRHRAGEERLSARRRDRAAGRRGAPPRTRRRTRQPSDHRHAQAGAGDRRPGRQGPAQDQGRAPVDGPDDRRALHGLRAIRRGHRRLAAARRHRARPAAQGGRQARPQGRRRDHPHRRAGRQARRPRARAAFTCSSSTRCSRSASKRRPAPALVFQEADLSVRVVRDIFSSAFERAIVDDPKQHHRLVSFFSRTAPELVDHVELWEEPTPLFEAFGVEEVLDSTLSRRVDLPSGGYLMIDYAEALTVIDVNSGSFTGRGKGARLEDTITKTNLEAAEEVVRQLRLRDIGGIIVIDFIDMARARNRDAVLKSLRKSLDEDRTKTFVVEISPLGLVEMTRQNVTDGVREIMTRPCPTCHGDRRDQVRGDDRDRVRAADARPRQADQGRGAADPDEPPRQRRVHRATRRACCARSSRTPASSSASRDPRDCRSTTSPSCWRASATRCSSARSRSARARRSTSRSSSRTCTAPATPSRRSTAT